jgi:hypothetical protein
VERDLVDEQDPLREDLQERERFDENHQRECEQEIRSYFEDSMF